MEKKKTSQVKGLLRFILVYFLIFVLFTAFLGMFEIYRMDALLVGSLILTVAFMGTYGYAESQTKMEFLNWYWEEQKKKK